MKRILFSIVCISIISTAFADPNAPDINTQLIQAAKGGNLAEVQTLLDNGADINAKRSTDGVTALMWAALKGHKEIVKLLMEKGADVNAISDDGLTALGAAKSQRHTDIIRLIDKTAIPPEPVEKSEEPIQAAKDSNSPTVQEEKKFPLNDAANQGDIEKVKELITKGYNVNEREDGDWTPLIWAARNGNKEIVEILMAAGADVNAKNNIGSTPVMQAIIFKHNDIAELLIKNGAQRTIFVSAAMGDIENVKALLKTDSNLINALSPDNGWSALHWAAYNGDLEMIKFLIENGANVNIRNTDDITPLFWAVRKDHLDAAKFLIKNGANVGVKVKNNSALLFYPGSLEAVKFLIDNGADVNAKNEKGMTPLHNIADTGGLNWVQRLLTDKIGWTFKTWKEDFEKQREPAQKVTAQIAELLISKGADVNAKAKDGRTPLWVAADADNKAVAELLIAKGADINPPDKLFIGAAGDEAFLFGKWNSRESFSQTVILQNGLKCDTFRWTGGDAGIRWPVTAGHSYRLQLACSPTSYIPEPNIFVNSQYVTTIKGTGMQFLDINIPADIIGDSNIAQIEVKSQSWVPFEKEPPSPDKRNLGITVTMFGMTNLSSNIFPDSNQAISANTVTFKSAEPAPENFDAWTFRWSTPEKDTDAAFWYSVVQPDGKEYFKYDFPASTPADRPMKSDFKAGFAGGEPSVFFNNHIRFKVSASKGNLVFKKTDITHFKFHFYKKDAQEKIDWKKPFKFIDVVVEPI